MKSNLESLPSNIRKQRNMCRIYINVEKQRWCVDDELGTHPVAVVIGGHTWAVETPNFSVVYEVNFHPYTVEVENHQIRQITDRNGIPLDEFWVTRGSSNASHFLKTRMLDDGTVDRVTIHTPWNRQKYGSEEGRRGAQEKYTMGW